MQGKPTATAYDDGHGHGIRRRPRPRKQAPGDVYGPRRAVLYRIAQNVQPRFLYFCGHCYRGGAFSFFQVHPKLKYHIVPLSHTQPLHTAPLSHFPKSPTNLIPKPFFAHNSLPIHHHFPPLTPRSTLFPIHSNLFPTHSLNL